MLVGGVAVVISIVFLSASSPEAGALFVEGLGFRV